MAEKMTWDKFIESMIELWVPSEDYAEELWNLSFNHMNNFFALMMECAELDYKNETDIIPNFPISSMQKDIAVNAMIFVVHNYRLNTYIDNKKNYTESEWKQIEMKINKFHTDINKLVARFTNKGL